MSRHIQTYDPEKRKLNNQSTKGKLILTTLLGRAVALLLQNGQLIWAQIFSLNTIDRIGHIYIGKVKNVVSNIDACFVEIANGEMCYLSLKDTEHATVLNRAARKDSSGTIKLVQGDEIPVQVIRNKIKTKPAAVTCAIELQSDLFVLKADAPQIAVSSKLDKANKKRVKELLTTEFDKNPHEYCVIARTECGNASDETIINAYNTMCRDFDELWMKARSRSCFSCIHEGNSPIQSLLDQIPAYEYDEIITDMEDVYQALESAKTARPIRFYTDETLSLANLYGLNAKFEAAIIPKVWMRSGANLVIEQTECLTAIDVNSSKNMKGRISEEIIYQINAEAAKEAAAQIRLRNLSGIIIIDFINMKDKTMEEELLTLLKEYTSKDPVTTKVIDITPLGLVEITRKKVHMSLKEQLNHEIC